MVWTLAVWLAVTGLTLAGAMRPLDRWIHDMVASLTPGSGAGSDIVVVAIDTPSFQDAGVPWPWPRSRHAALLDAVREAGASAVIFDIVFDAETPDDPGFARAIARFGPVILAAEKSLATTPQGLIQTRALPAPGLASRAAGVGYASLPLDGDGRLRRLPGDPDALAAVAAARLFGVTPPVTPRDRYIRFRDRPFPTTVSYYQALSPDSHLPPGLLDGKILLVGLALEASPTGTAIGDSLLFPRQAGAQVPQPGVIAHAHVLETLISGDARSRAPRLAEILIGAAAFGLSVLFMSALAESIPRGFIVVGAALFGLFVLVLASHGAGWVVLAGPAFAGLLLSAAGQVTLIGGAALAARRRLAAGFARYVSPEILRNILDADEPPELGGEEREVSVIVTDLEGFTTLMEQMPPADGAALLRDYLDTLSAVILAHGGMIDQFVGDSIVALFNAPLEQSDHATRAVDCVRALDRAAEAFRREHAGLGRTRIGAAMGRAVVGNFGARQRFHYTAMGDVVNVAARLEAANKPLGTRALVTEILFEAAGSPEGFGSPQPVELAGKTHPVRALPLRD